MSEETFDFDGEFGDIEDELDLTLYADAEELSGEVVAQTLQLIADGLADKFRFDLALTGGTLGLAISTKLVESFNNLTNSFSGLHIWFSDERYVAAASQERNSLPFHQTLENKNISVHEVLPTDFAVSATGALQDYEEKLAQVSLDLVILGVGPDGHVASIFPGSSNLDDMRKVFLIEDSPKPPATRISFTMATINSSQNVWLVASGESKADAVTKILEGDSSVPASYVRGSRHTRLIIDTEAFFAE